ncbi:MAG: hypothetical protein ABWJ98_07605 [Hydrogenothermaceae bacterium]
MIRAFLILVIFFIGISKSEEEIIRTEPLYIIADFSKKEPEKYTVYKVYAFGIPVGEVYFSIKEDKIEAHGQTYKRLKFLYSYDFIYIDKDDYKALYEKEKDKEKLYENQEIYEKKTWLPIIALFFRGNITDEKILNLNIKINDAPVLVKKEENSEEKIFYFLPQNSKTKKITVYIKKGENLPYRIDIEGKTNISLERITQQ